MKLSGTELRIAAICEIFPQAPSRGKSPPSCCSRPPLQEPEFPPSQASPRSRRREDAPHESAWDFLPLSRKEPENRFPPESDAESARATPFRPEFRRGGTV